MPPSPHRREAADYHRSAARYYYRARKNAKDAARWYRQAAGQASSARRLTRRPEFAHEASGYTAALMEESARTWERIADTTLQMSFAYTAWARRDSEMARHYEALAESQEARWFAADVAARPQVSDPFANVPNADDTEYAIWGE